MSEDQTALRTQLVKRSQLDAVLPPDTVKVTREQRIGQMCARFEGIRRRYVL